MTAEVAGFFEVTISQAVEVLTAYAKRRDIRVTSKRVHQILLDEITTGKLSVKVLARDVSGKIDVEQTTLDPRVFLDDGHTWLVAHGLHPAEEAYIHEYPEFPSLSADIAIANWIEDVLPELRYMLLTIYEICDLKAQRVHRTLEAMLSEKTEVAPELVEKIKAARLQMELDADDVALEQETLHQKERESLLKLVIGMAMAGYKYDPTSKRNSAVSEIAHDLAAKGLGLDEDTVRKWLKVATGLIDKN